MLHHTHLGAALPDDRAQPGLVHQVIAGGDVDTQIGAAEDDAAARWAGRQAHGYRHAGMQGGAGDGDGMGDSAAGRHGGSVARTAKPPKAVAGSRRQAFTSPSAYGASRMRWICAFVALLV